MLCYGYGDCKCSGLPNCKCSGLPGLSVWSQTHGPGVGLLSEEIFLNRMFHCYSISFMAQRLSPLISVNILVILSWTRSFHRLIAVAKADLVGPQKEEPCRLLPPGRIKPKVTSGTKLAKLINCLKNILTFPAI